MNPHFSLVLTNHTRHNTNTEYIVFAFFTRDKNLNKITIKGELTIYQAEESARILFEDLSLFEKPIKVDLSGVTEIDTAGIQILLMLEFLVYAAM